MKAYTVDHRNVFFIVQFANDGDQRGVVRDIAQPKDTSSSFEFKLAEAVDQREAETDGSDGVADERGLARKSWIGFQPEDQVPKWAGRELRPTKGALEFQFYE